MSNVNTTEGYRIITNWLADQSKTPFSFQKQTWNYYHEKYNGLVIAVTDFGKTFSVLLAVVIDNMNHPERNSSGLKLLWITPVRSVAEDLAKAMQGAVGSIGLDWIIEVR